jgi:hypothetical protein
VNVTTEIRVLRSLDDIEAIRADLTRLNSHPEHNWDIYWSVFRDQKHPPEPYVAALLEDGRLRAGLVGRVERGHVHLKLGYWKPVRVPVRRIFIPRQGLLGQGDAGALRAMVERVVQDLRDRRADLAVFEFPEQDSALHRAAKGVALGFWMRDRAPERRVHRYLTLPATFEEFDRQHKGLLQKVRKFEKAFEGRYEHRLLTREDEIEAFCDGADALVSGTWQRGLGIGFLNSEEHRGRIRAAARRGAWRAFVTLVDRKTVAFWIGCSFGSSAFLWWTAYDASQRVYSPGLVALTRMVEHLISKGVTTVDFGGGDAPYKERLCNDSRWEENVCIFAPGFKGVLAHGVHGLDEAVRNLSRTTLKGLANRLKTPWRRLIARRMSRREAPRLTHRKVPQVGEWVEVCSLEEIRATLDGAGELEHLPFMPEMARHCGHRARVAAAMTKICGGGRRIRGILGEPLVLLDELRCGGETHGQCSRACTLLWKPAWFRPVDPLSPGLFGERDERSIGWPYRTQAESGAYLCQATALPRATVPISTPRKVLSALEYVRQGERTLGSLATFYLRTRSYRLGSLVRRASGVVGKKRSTPVEKLGLRPGEWVQVKPLSDISATLDRNNRNRGLEFSRYMIPFCGGTYRVNARMENFIDERTGEVRRLENTVLLEGVSCGGETSSGPCLRAEYLYWREIWLRRAEAPPAGS